MNLKDKSGDWFSKKIEYNFRSKLLSGVPSWLETYHLTWMTLLWSIAVVACFYLGKENYFFFWLVPLFVGLQYISDLLDGAVGRDRNTGLIKWGYYVDHFLDFVFMNSIIVGYGLVLGFNIWILILQIILSAFMVHSFLMVSANKCFQISFCKIGPTEGRILFIVFHLFIIAKDVFILKELLPYITVLAGLALVFLFLSAQNNLWKQDLEQKNNLS